MSNDYRRPDTLDEVTGGLGCAAVIFMILGINRMIDYFQKNDYYSREVKFESQSDGTVIGQSSQAYFAIKRPEQIDGNIRLKALPGQTQSGRV